MPELDRAYYESVKSYQFSSCWSPENERMRDIASVTTKVGVIRHQFLSPLASDVGATWSGCRGSMAESSSDPEHRVADPTSPRTEHYHNKGEKDYAKGKEYSPSHGTLATITELFAPVYGDSADARAENKEVPLHSLLEYGSIVLAIVCLLSLISWAAGIQPFVIVNPFVALLSLVMSPFVYWMGRTARR